MGSSESWQVSHLSQSESEIGRQDEKSLEVRSSGSTRFFSDDKVLEGIGMAEEGVKFGLSPVVEGEDPARFCAFSWRHFEFYDWYGTETELGNTVPAQPGRSCQIQISSFFFQMPPTTWLFNAVAPMALRYIRRRYRRKIGNALYNRVRRSYTTNTRHLRGTRPATRRAMVKRSPNPKKRQYQSAMGGRTGPAVRSSVKKSRFAANLGVPESRLINKKHGLQFSTNIVPDKTLSAHRLISVDWSDDDTSLKTRQGKLCNVKGVKMRVWFNLQPAKGSYPNATTSDPNSDNMRALWEEPLQVRWAIINPKNNDGSTTNLDKKFFISDNPIDEASQNFPTSGNCFAYMNRKINRAEYGVLQEGTFILRPPNVDYWTGGGTVPLTGKKFISTWIPINKQMRWETTQQFDYWPVANVFFVYWYCKLGDSNAGKAFPLAGTPLYANPIDVHCERITYFHDVQS